VSFAIAPRKDQRSAAPIDAADMPEIHEAGGSGSISLALAVEEILLSEYACRRARCDHFTAWRKLAARGLARERAT
jgi:hypothetical protein